jgi:putative ABC transport system permease protein
VIGRDLRQAIRSLLRTPGPTLTILLLLTLGIGLNTALFTLVNGAFLRPLPYKDESRLVFVWEVHPERGRVAVAPGSLALWRSASSTVESAAASFPWKMELARGEPEHVNTLLATDGYFPMFGVPPLLGRPLDAKDYAWVHGLSKWWGTGDTVVISEGFWKRNLGSDPSAIGQILRLDGKAFTVVGVMPAAFQAFWVDTDVWLPWVLSPEEWQDRESHELPVVARLRAGATREAAEAEISALYAGAASETGLPTKGWRVDLVPLRSMIVGDTGRTLLLLLGGAALVLLVTCSSVASLLLARAARRERDTAVRCSLGASPWPSPANLSSRAPCSPQSARSGARPSRSSP